MKPLIVLKTESVNQLEKEKYPFSSVTFLALFSQAVLINNMYFAIIGLIAFIIFIVDYVKQSKRV